MNPNQPKKIKTAVIWTVTLFFSFIFGILIAYGGWIPRPNNPPQENVPKLIHIGNDNQTKQGGLILNKLGTAKEGLIVSDAKGQGLVGIGAPPKEKLDVNGNLNITGLILPDGKGGPAEDVFTRTKTGNELKNQWGKRRTWMTIFTGPAICSLRELPSPRGCDEFGYKEYTSLCVPDQTTVTGVGTVVRICYRDLQ